MSDLQLNYYYYFLNATDGNLFKDNEDGYYYICTIDLTKLQNVQVLSALLKYETPLCRLICRIHNSRKINQIIRLPFKKAWYPKYYKFNEPNGKPICFVLNNFQLPYEYIQYLKNRYPKAKFVKIHRDLLKLFYIRYPSYTKQKCDSLFDLSLTYDRKEATEQRWPSFTEFESKIEIPKEQTQKQYGVFFAGKAKDRLPLLFEVYNRLLSAGIKCDFYLTGVPKDERVDYPGIEYADFNMTYREMLIRTANCNCILEINQEGSEGFTSRFLEAVMYNKKLLTNNLSIKKSKFYNANFICCFDDPKNIDIGFLRNSGEIDYGYNDEFSPINLIKEIDLLLSNNS